MADEQVREALIAGAIDVLGAPHPPAMPLREVAAAAGVTTGAVQHHFGNRHGLLLAAVDRQTEVLVRRLEAVEAAHPSAGAARVRTLLRELLPLDAVRVREARLVSAFIRLAADDDALAAEFRIRYRRLIELLRDDLPGGEQDAALLLSVVDGTSGDVLLGLVDEDGALALVERFLRLLGV